MGWGTMEAHAVVVLPVPVTLSSRSGETGHCRCLPAHMVGVKIKVREGI